MIILIEKWGRTKGAERVPGMDQNNERKCGMASRAKEKADAMRGDRQQKKAAIRRFFRYFFAYVKKNPYLCRRNWRSMTAQTACGLVYAGDTR